MTLPPPAGPPANGIPGLAGPDSALTAAEPAAGRGRPARRVLTVTAVALAGLACLAASVLAGVTARAEQVRPPTRAERAAAAAAAVARRWRTWTAGQLFPAELGYTTFLLTRDHAHRAGIAPGHGCAAALTGTAVRTARADGCRAALRATYLGGLQGIVYTAGVLAFPGRARAAAFVHAVAGQPLPSGLRAFALPGTAAARFTEAARQVAATRQAGPYVVLVVAGYADGRPASATGERRQAVFTPARQLATDILVPLTQPPAVRCASPEWSC